MAEELCVRADLDRNADRGLEVESAVVPIRRDEQQLSSLLDALDHRVLEPGVEVLVPATPKT